MTAVRGNDGQAPPPMELRNSMWNFRKEMDDSFLYKWRNYGCRDPSTPGQSIVIELLDVITFSPNYTRFPYMPNNCHVWIDYGGSYILRSRECDGGYCLDLYFGEEIAHRGIGGKFEFNSYASPLFVASVQLMTR